LLDVTKLVGFNEERISAGAAIPNGAVVRNGDLPMLRNALVGLAAATLLSAVFVPDDALAYRGGGARVHAGGAVGVRGGAVAGRGVAYRGAAYRGGAYRGAAYRGGYPYRGAAIGAAAVGAAAAGAAAYGAYGAYNNGYYGGYNNGCFRDAYGNLVCQQY
jgi:hypothetical protein